MPAGGGPQYLKLLQLADEYPGLVTKRMMTGSTRGADSTARIRRWQLEYDGLTSTLADSLVTHKDSAKFQLLGFGFTDPRTATVYTNVHYEEFTIDHTKTWSHKVTVVLVKEGLP